MTFSCFQVFEVSLVEIEDLHTKRSCRKLRSLPIPSIEPRCHESDLVRVTTESQTLPKLVRTAKKPTQHMRLLSRFRLALPEILLKRICHFSALSALAEPCRSRWRDEYARQLLLSRLVPTASITALGNSLEGSQSADCVSFHSLWQDAGPCFRPSGRSRRLPELAAAPAGRIAHHGSKTRPPKRIRRQPWQRMLSQTSWSN